MTLLKRTLTCSLALSAMFTATYASSEQTTQSNLIVEYSAPQNVEEEQLKREIQNSGVNDTVVDLSNQLFMFEKPLTIQYGGEEGPLYDPQTHQVLILIAFTLSHSIISRRTNTKKSTGNQRKPALLIPCCTKLGTRISKIRTLPYWVKKKMQLIT